MANLAAEEPFKPSPLMKRLCDDQCDSTDWEVYDEAFKSAAKCKHIKVGKRYQVSHYQNLVDNS